MEMNSEKFKGELEGLKGKAQALEAELAEEKAELDRQKNQFSNLKVLHAGKKKTPGSLQTTERLLWEAEKRHQATLDAVTFVNDKISHLEKTLQSCALYDTEAGALKRSIEGCEGSVRYVNERSKELEEQILSFIASLRDLMHSTQEIATHFSRLHSGLEKTFSLRSFLEGRLEEVEDDTLDRQKLAQEVGERMISFTNLPALVSVESIQSLENVIEWIGAWQRTIKTIPNAKDVSLSRHSLIPTQPQRKQIKPEKLPNWQKFYPEKPEKMRPQKTPLFRQKVL
jgi:chromosome segregation ATPase